MTARRRLVAVLAATLLLAACAAEGGGTTTTTAEATETTITAPVTTSTTAASTTTAQPADHHTGDEVDTADIVAASLATAAFQDLAAAEAAGYGSTLDALGCFENAEEGGMGRVHPPRRGVDLGSATGSLRPRVPPTSGAPAVGAARLDLEGQPGGHVQRLEPEGAHVP